MYPEPVTLDPGGGLDPNPGSAEDESLRAFQTTYDPRYHVVGFPECELRGREIGQICSKVKIVGGNDHPQQMKLVLGSHSINQLRV